jgi:hypothetical protein
MVAYSFKARFAEPIIAGTKCQTIRAPRKRHARPGEALQLYTGMRTKQCRKLLDVDPICTFVTPVQLCFDRTGHFLKSTIVWYEIPVRGIEQQNKFAQADGFTTVHEMAEFWFATHARGTKRIEFDGILIQWEPEEQA